MATGPQQLNSYKIVAGFAGDFSSPAVSASAIK
jgi:hypothetical protein